MTPTPPGEASFEEDIKALRETLDTLACTQADRDLLGKAMAALPAIYKDHARELAAARAETWKSAADDVSGLFGHGDENLIRLREIFEQRAAAAEKEGR